MPFIGDNDRRLFYDISGKGTMALLFLHGLGGDSRIWKYQADYFRKKHQVITVDLFGHGRSAKAIDPVYAPRFDAEMAVELMIEKVKRPFFAVGHSQAGMVLQEMARLCGPELQGLIFVDCVFPGFDDVVTTRMEFAKMMLNYADNRLAVETRQYYRSMLSADISPEAEALILAPLDRCDFRWLFESAAGIEKFIRKYNPRDIPIPPNRRVFIVEAGYGIGQSLRQSWVHHFRQARYYLFEFSHHFFFVTENGQFNSVLEDFIRDEEQGRPY